MGGVESVVCPTSPEYDFEFVRRTYSDPIVIPEAGYVFRSHTFLLGWTIEKIWLPHRSRLAARVEGKSSLARLGIGVHVTAPTIHAGFGYKKDDEAYPGSPLQLDTHPHRRPPGVTPPMISLVTSAEEMEPGPDLPISLSRRFGKASNNRSCNRSRRKPILAP